jgi:F-type H+-transporting ATPase subunit alpha
MKQVAGPLRIELAQYKELSAFTQLGSDLSKDTLERLNHGERIVEMLKQPQYEPVPVENQVVLFYLLTNKFFSDVYVENVQQTARDFLEFLDARYKNVTDDIRNTGALSDESSEQLKAASAAFKESLAESQPEEEAAKESESDV